MVNYEKIILFLLKCFLFFQVTFVHIPGGSPNSCSLGLYISTSAHRISEPSRVPHASWKSSPFFHMNLSLIPHVYQRSADRNLALWLPVVIGFEVPPAPFIPPFQSIRSLIQSHVTPHGPTLHLLQRLQWVQGEQHRRVVARCKTQRIVASDLLS